MTVRNYDEGRVTAPVLVPRDLWHAIVTHLRDREDVDDGQPNRENTLLYEIERAGLPDGFTHTGEVSGEAIR